METIVAIKHSKYMRVGSVSFKKTDLKRIEYYDTKTMLYITVVGRKDPICIPTTPTTYNQDIQNILETSEN